MTMCCGSVFYIVCSFLMPVVCVISDHIVEAYSCIVTALCIEINISLCLPHLV